MPPAPGDCRRHRVELDETAFGVEKHLAHPGSVIGGSRESTRPAGEDGASTSGLVRYQKINAGGRPTRRSVHHADGHALAPTSGNRRRTEPHRVVGDASVSQLLENLVRAIRQCVARDDCPQLADDRSAAAGHDVTTSTRKNPASIARAGVTGTACFHRPRRGAPEMAFLRRRARPRADHRRAARLRRSMRRRTLLRSFSRHRRMTRSTAGSMPDDRRRRRQHSCVVQLLQLANRPCLVCPLAREDLEEDQPKRIEIALDSRGLSGEQLRRHTEGCRRRRRHQHLRPESRFQSP